MTPTEKARTTRKKNDEARKAKAQEVKEIREKLKKSCLTLLDDPNTSPAERLRATEILHELIKGR